MTSDVRFDALCTWLGGVLPVPMLSIEPASADASFRRYFRITLGSAHSLTEDGTPRRTLIAMDAPPPNEDCRPFVRVARMLTDAGVHSPAVLAKALDEGFLLLSDLGRETYLAALTDATAPALYGEACAALVRWQLSSRPDSLPPYDEALLRRELDLFPDWYVARHIGVALDQAQRDTLNAMFRRILDNNLAQARVYVHRDYHSRNLMVSDPNPGVLDFQDAVFGPITYDLVSLLRDAYVEWDEALQIDWAARYWQRARSANLPVAADFGTFWRDFEWMGVQRQLKVLGIFARLYHRDGKDAYLKEMPRVMRYLRGACSRYDELSPLLRLLDEFEARAARRRLHVLSASVIAMILAAGRGERMRPLSDALPKPLLEVGGKPLIVWQIERLVSAGFSRLVINVSHLGHLVEAALGDGRQFGAAIRYSRETEPLEVAGGIATALPLLGDGVVLVVSGDIHTGYDYGALRAGAHAMAATDHARHLHMVMVPNPPYHAAGDFVLTGDRLALSGGERLTFGNIALYRTSLFAELPRGRRLKMLPCYRDWIGRGWASGEIYAGPWENVGTPEELASLDSRLRRGVASTENE